MTEQQTPKLMGVLVEHQDAFSPLPIEDAQWVIRNPKEAISLFLIAVKNRVREAATTIKNILSPVKKITIAATAEKRTEECFADSKKYYRDPSVLSLLPEFQPARGVEQGQVSQLNERSKFLGMVQSLLGVMEDGIAVLSRLIIESFHIYTLTQIEQLVERQEAGEDVGLLTNGWGNFFLVLNREGSVSVVDVIRAGSQWLFFAYVLGFVRVWSVGRRFFSRNKTL
ncbi:MAG TPA: hypothetical protein VJH67_02255 [Candidatus Paceibacterota bacterium]